MNKNNLNKLKSIPQQKSLHDMTPEELEQPFPICKSEW